MKTEETSRKLRRDLTAEQIEKALTIGDIGNKSSRYSQMRRFEKFIPAKGEGRH